MVLDRAGPLVQRAWSTALETRTATQGSTGARRPTSTGVGQQRRERSSVPKMKSHTGMGKRVKVTGKGKLVREQAGKRHLLEGKSSKRTRRLALDTTISKADAKKVRRLLGR